MSRLALRSLQGTTATGGIFRIRDVRNAPGEYEEKLLGLGPEQAAATRPARAAFVAGDLDGAAALLEAAGFTVGGYAGTAHGTVRTLVPIAVMIPAATATALHAQPGTSSAAIHSAALVLNRADVADAELQAKQQGNTARISVRSTAALEAHAALCGVSVLQLLRAGAMTAARPYLTET